MPTDSEYDVFLKPDAILAQLEAQLKTASGADAETIRQKITARQGEIASIAGSAGFGSYGFVTPNIAYSESSGPQYAELLAKQTAMQQALAGKLALLPTGEAGVYSGAYYNDKGGLNYGDPRLGMTNDPAAKGMANYDPNATGSQRAFFDASGNRLTAAQAAATKSGQQFAAAGWDIGYGPGMIGPGIKADTSEREARIAARQNKVQAQTETEQPASKPVSPTPQTPTQPAVFLPPPQPVKVAPIDTILFPADDLLPVEIMADLIFENIGGQELINISRNDTINGQTVSYQPIKNISIVQQSYNPNNIVSIQQTADKIFAGFAIKFDSKIPNEGNGPGGSTIYRDTNTGDIVLEFVNIEGNEQIEIQFAINGTIYEADI